jgi:hypothetical protein
MCIRDRQCIIRFTGDSRQVGLNRNRNQTIQAQVMEPVMRRSAERRMA